jgi:DNA mismatch repair ATPase MutL
MKLKYILGAAALSLIFAGTAYPQQEQEKEKPQQEEKKPAEQPKQQPAEKPKTQERQGQEHQAAKQQQQEQKNEQKQEKQDQKQQERQQPATKQQRNDEQRTEQRSGGGHGRIPDERFHASFGREHHFRVGHVDNRRFQYGGYWFVYNEAWPREWSYDDDFYIDYIDGQYYLIDLTHPGIQLLLVVE